MTLSDTVCSDCHCCMHKWNFSLFCLCTVSVTCCLLMVWQAFFQILSAFSMLDFPQGLSW